MLSDTFGKSSTEILMNYTLLEGLLEVDMIELVNLLLLQASNDRFGESGALKKASQIRESKLNTFDITLGTDMFKLQIQLLLEQIQLIEWHLSEIEQIMIEVSNRNQVILIVVMHGFLNKAPIIWDELVGRLLLSLAIISSTLFTLSKIT